MAAEPSCQGQHGVPTGGLKPTNRGRASAWRYPVTVTRSLYEAFGERVLAPNSDPGTLYTASVETIDNDVILQELAILSAAEPLGGAGTARLVVDAHQPLEPAGSGPKPRPTPRPRPRPGTSLTATVETTDEDASFYLDILR